MKRLFPTLLLCLPLLTLVHCAAPSPEDDLAESADEGLSVRRDDLNGLWVAQVGPGTPVRESVIEAWTEIGVRLELDGRRHVLKQSGARLLGAAPAVALKSYPNGPDFADDVIEGTIDGASVRLERDTSPKPPITLALPADRPFRSFLADRLGPAAQRDRESYVVMSSNELRTFLQATEAYKKGFWHYKYLAGADRAEENVAFEKIVAAVDGAKTTPRLLIREPKFADAVRANVRAPFLFTYAVSDLGLYFSTAAGRAVRMPLANDTTIYFITDRPERKEKLGLVLTESPLHGKLAATFGQQLSELEEMTAADDTVYAKAMMDLLARSDGSRVAQLSPAGRAAIADWYGIMAIEDYRGIAFGRPELAWGYNFTNAQFYGLVVRALARPSQTDSAGKPVIGQVIVGSELRPGDPSYADVLNDGKDMQEYPDMAKLKQLATGYLLEQHPAAVGALLDAFAGIVPTSALDTRARYDVFHYLCAQLYDGQGRTALLTPQAAAKAVTAVGALVDILRAESSQLEAYILAHGFTKSSVRAPQAKGL